MVKQIVATLLCLCAFLVSTKAHGNIKILVNPDSKLIAYLNQTAKMAMIFDLANSIVLATNGKSGDALIIDSNTSTGAHVTGTAFYWFNARASFEDYFKTLPSLKNVLVKARQFGKKFKVRSPNSSILQLVAKRSPAFGIEAGKQIRKDLKGALTLLVKPVKLLHNAMKNGNSDILPQFEQHETEAKNVTLDQFVNIFTQLPTLVDNVAGGVKTLIKHKVKLSLKLIFAAKSGIEIVGNVINVTTAAGVNMAKTAKELTINKLFEMIALLSKGANAGYESLVRAVGLLIGVVKGTVEIEPLIDALVKLSVTTLPQNAFKLLTDQLQELLKTLAKLPNTEELKNTIEDVKKLISGKLVIRGIDISKTIANLVKAGVKPPLQLVVNGLVAINYLVDVAKSIPSLILHLLTNLNNGIDYQAVYKLFPNVKIDDNAIANGNFFDVVFKGLTMKDKNMVDFLHKVPIIGPMLQAINVAGNYDFKLIDLLKSVAASVIVKKIEMLINISNRLTKKD